MKWSCTKLDWRFWRQNDRQKLTRPGGSPNQGRLHWRCVFFFWMKLSKHVVFFLPRLVAEVNFKDYVCDIAISNPQRLSYRTQKMRSTLHPALHQASCHHVLWGFQLGFQLTNWDSNLPTGIPTYQLGFQLPNWDSNFPTGIPTSQLGFQLPNWDSNLPTGIPTYQLGFQLTNRDSNLPTGIPTYQLGFQLPNWDSNLPTGNLSGITDWSSWRTAVTSIQRLFKKENFQVHKIDECCVIATVFQRS